MSAECGTCGSDIVYPAGTWPIGECPTCTTDTRYARLREAALHVVLECRHGGEPTDGSLALLAELVGEG